LPQGHVVERLLKETGGILHSEDLILDAVRDLLKDEVKGYIRSRLDANPALKQELKEAVGGLMEAKLQEAYALMKVAKSRAKLGLELVPPTGGGAAPASGAPAPEPSHGEVNRALFATASLSALKGIAKAFGLAVKGSRKPAYIDALVVHPRSDEMAEALRDLGGIAQDTKEVEAVGRDLQAIAERVRMPEVRDAEADALPDAALNASVDSAG